MPEVAKYDLTIKRHSLMSAGAPDSWAVDLSLAHATLDEQIRSAFVPDDGLAVFMPFPIACRFNDSGEITFNVYASSDIGGARYRLRLWDGPAVIGTVFVTMPRSVSNLVDILDDADVFPVALTVRGGSSDDSTPSSTELTITGDLVASHSEIEIPTYAGDKHDLIARLASEPDITSLIIQSDPTRVNQLVGFDEWPDVVTSGGRDYAVWVSIHALSNVNGRIWEVS